jgi:hypothetical protein
LFVRWTAVAFFLTERDRAAWLATIDRPDPLLLMSAEHPGGLLEHARDGLADRSDCKTRRSRH